MLINEQIILAYLSGELTESENILVEEWEGLSEDNRNKFQLVAQIYFAQEQEPLLNTSKAYRKLSRQIKTPTKNGISRKRYLYLAASIILIFSSFGLFNILSSTYKELAPTVLYSETTKNFQVKLPDNSIIYLNSHTKITIPGDFSKTNRNVKLEGEAFFEIASDKENPFIVQTSDHLNIQVLGTKFNLQAYPNDTLLTARLYSGKIRVGIDDYSENIMELEPQEEIRFNPESSKLIKSTFSEHENNIGWRNNKITFKNAGIEDVIRSIALFYQVNFDAKAIAHIKTSINGEFENKNIETVLDYLSAVSGINYEIDNTTKTPYIRLYVKE